MPKVLLEMSMSLDGFVTGPDVTPDEPMGRGGEQLHEWMFEGRSAAEARAFQDEHFRTIGALIIGRRMADLGIGPWGDEPPFRAPVFVVTHRPAATIVTGGIDHALRLAREAAGPADVQVNGGADIARQYLRAGALDELRLHLVPVLLGAGTRLFDGAPPNVGVRPLAAVHGARVTDLTYALGDAAAEVS